MISILLLPEQMHYEKKRFEYFTSNEPIFDIEKYDKAEARVIAVSQQSARLEICGVELTLPMNELFWSWVADVREHLSLVMLSQLKFLMKVLMKKETSS